MTKRVKAQSTLEYALLIAVVIGSLLYMQNYLKRSMQGRLQRIGDQMSEQYSPGLTFRNTHSTSNIEQVYTEETRGVGSLQTEVTTGAEQDRNELRRLKDLKEEEWPE
jgi:hypothetical protein